MVDNQNGPYPAPGEYADIVSDPRLIATVKLPDGGEYLATKQMIAGARIRRGDLLFENPPESGRVQAVTADVGGPIIGIATMDARTDQPVEMLVSAEIGANLGAAARADQARVYGKVTGVDFAESDFPVDLADNTALADYLGLSADDFLTIADFADSAGLERSADYWKMIAAVLRGRVLPVGNVIDVLTALTVGNANG